MTDNLISFTEEDVREIAAEALFRSAMNGLGDWSTEIDEERDYWRSHSDAVLAAVEPVIRRQERVKVAEELAGEFDEYAERCRRGAPIAAGLGETAYNASRLIAFERAAAIARSHSTQPGEETK